MMGKRRYNRKQNQVEEKLNLNRGIQIVESEILDQKKKGERNNYKREVGNKKTQINQEKDFKKI